MALETSGINTLFTSPHAKDNFKNLDPIFINSFYGFLKDYGCTEIELNSTFRPNKKTNGSHAWGRAVDINRILVKGQWIYFNFKFGAKYDDKKDQAFYEKLLEVFGSKLYNYYSPAIVRHATSTKAVNNTFRFSKNRVADVLKAESIPSAKRNWNESHLNHCHLAIDHDGQMAKEKTFASKIVNPKNKKNWMSLLPASQLSGEESIYRW